MVKQTSQKRVLFTRGSKLLALCLISIVIVMGILTVATRQANAVSSVLNFQARLMTASGTIVPDGNYNVEFKIYNALSSSGSSQGSCTGDAACQWTETRTSGNQVHVVNGYLTVNLGSVTALPNIDWSQSLWLTMNIGGTGSPVWDGEMNPRLALTAVPYAFTAGQLAAHNGANTSTLGFTTPTANRTITLPDASGTVCLQSSAACGFALTSGSGSYIQNGTTTQAANFNVQAASSGSVAATLQANAAGTGDILDLKNGTGAPIATFSSAGAVLFKNSTNSTTGFQIQGAILSTPVFDVDTTNSKIGINTNTPTESLDVVGNLQVKDASTPTKGYRLRTSGSALDFEASGADLYMSVWSGANYTGTQYNQFILSASGSNINAQRGINIAGLAGQDILHLNASGGGTTDVVNSNGDLTLQGTTGSYNAFRVNNTSGVKLLGVDTNNGLVTVGNASTTSGQNIAGQLLFADGTLDGFNATVNTSTLTNNRTISLPDASGTVCLQSSAACGFAPGTSGSYIQNQTTVQTANAFLQSASSSSITEVLQGAAGQSVDIFDVKSSTPATFLSVGSTGKTTLQSSVVNAAVLTLNNSDGTTGIEFRSGGTGLNDIFIGTNAGSSTTTGDKNTAVGTQALKTNADGVNNSAFGYFSLNSNTSGGKNTAVGYYSLQSNQTGNNNTAVGYYAFQGNTGGNNTALGYYAGYQDPATGTFQSGTTLSNSTAIGYGSQVQASNTLTLGGQGTNAVKVGIGTTIPSNTLSVSPVQYNTGTASQTGTTVSGTSTVWTSAMVGDELIFANGVKETITGFTNGTTLTASVSQSVTAQAYRLHYVGFQVTSGGLVGIGNATPGYTLDVAGDINTTTALRVAGTSVCDTVGSTGCVAKSGSGYYIHNQTGVQSANLNVQAATSGSVAAVLQGNASGTADVLDINNGAGALLGSIGSAGAVLLQNSTDSTNALTLMTSVGGTNEAVLRVDTVSERVAIGVVGGTPSAKLNIATGSTVGLRVFESGAFDAFELANSTSDIFDISQTGTILQKTTTNSANALQIEGSTNVTAFDVDTTNTRVGIGTSTPSRTADISISNAVVNALPLLIEQGGAGDSGIELKTATQSFYVGADGSDGNFKVSSNTASSTSTVFGYNTAGPSTDSTDQNSMNACKFTAGASGTISQLNAFIATVDASPNNKAQMAIYTDSSGSPGTLLASSASVTLTANVSNAFPIAPVSIASGTVYWLVYNTNSSSSSKNNFKLLTTGGTNQSKFVSQTYGTWPSSWSGGSYGDGQVSFYGSISSTTPTDDFSSSLFTIGNSGQATFENTTNGTAAFRIQKADATLLFNVDTSSEIITLGPSGGDATGTVLVLGNKTGSSSDPTGTPGAMYYNVTLNAFRCYENGVWYNCLTHHIVTLGADVTNNNGTANTIADVTGLSFAVTSGTTYHFHALIDYTAAATSTGSRWTINGPTTTLLGYTSMYGFAATSLTTNFANAYNIPAASNAASPNTTGNTATIEGMVTPSASGTIIVRFASGIASSAIVAKAGSTIEWW